MATVAAPAPACVVPAGLVADGNPDTGGTDNAPAIQAAINGAMASRLPVALPPGLYAVASTLTLDPAVNVSFGGVPAGRLGPDDLSRGTGLLWAGPPGGTMISLRGIKCRLHDLLIASARNTSLDVCVDVEAPASYPGVSSQHLFEAVACYGLAGPVAKGWVVGADQRANHELMWWRSCCTRYCSYAGVQVPNGTFQSKNHVLEDCTFGGPGQYGVVFATGSAALWRCNFDALDCAAKWFGGAYEPLHFLSCTGEDCGRFLQAGGAQYVILHGCRLNFSRAANPQVLGDEFLNGGGNWHVVACAFEDAQGDVPLEQYWRPNNGATVTAEACACVAKSPLSADLQSGWRGFFANVRRDQRNDLVHAGPWYQANSPGMSFAGQGLILGTGQWPGAGAYDAGAYTPGPGEVKLYNDGSGNLYVSVGGGPPRPVLLGPAAP